MSPQRKRGLTALLKEGFAVPDPAQLRTYAARVLAVEISTTGGIIEVITNLTDRGVPLDAAVTIALRAQRGMTDTNRAGGATKDHSHLTGPVALRRLPREDIDLLRFKKWPMKNLPLLRQISAEGDLAPIRCAARADLLGLSGAAPSRIGV